MNKGRLEAFSDGVMAIIITIMVLELKIPHGTDFEAIRPLAPVFVTYILSFIYLGIYWNNHHHLLQAAKQINGTNLVGKSASFVLAVAHPVRHGLDGRKSFRPTSDRRLRNGSARRGNRLLHSANSDNCANKAKIPN